MNLHLNNTVMKTLTENELNILQYIYQNSEQIPDMSIHAFASAVSFSTATVLRFCKKLGYSGFAELKYTLRLRMQTPSDTPPVTEPESDSHHMILGTLSENVENTARLIQEEQLYRTFRFLDGSCAVYLWAPGGVTSVLADYFEKLLFSVGREKVYKIDAFRIGEHLLHNLTANALLILISVTGNFAPTVHLAKLAHAKNIPVLSITPYSNNTIADHSTVSFRFFTSQRENQGAEFTSRLPVFFVIRFIIRSYLLYRQNRNVLTQTHSASSNRSKQPCMPLFQNAHSLTLTETERQLLEYMESHLSDCAFSSLKELEDCLYTSGATIVRFCQKLGLEGFNELKYQMRSHLSSRQDSLLFTDRLLSRSIALFHDNVQNIDLALLQTIADLLTGNRPVYIYGNELNSVAARYLHIILTALDYPSILLEWPHLLQGLAYEMNSRTILFVLAAHEDTLPYFTALEKTKQRGICNILLTCRPDSPLHTVCDYVLYANDRPEEYRHVDVSGRIGMLTIIQLFIELLVHKH